MSPRSLPNVILILFGDVLASQGLVLLLITFLHCSARISRNLANQLLSIFNIMFLALSPQPHHSFPLDVRTALRHFGIETDFTRHGCCPKCFGLYNIKDPTKISCSYRALPNGRPCGAKLRDKVNRPLRFFSTQSLETWLSRFLKRPEIDAALNETSADTSSLPYGDIRRSPLWRVIRKEDGQIFLEGPGRLAFSLYVDWFNPLGNKAAGEPNLIPSVVVLRLYISRSGKKVSFGTIALFCLNLPPSLRNKHENIFLFGIMPGPTEPSLEQINHLLRPLVKQLLYHYEVGITIPTPTSPDGQLFQSALLTLVSDLPASRKTAGFASHSATHFCPNCDLTLHDIGSLDFEGWERRSWREQKLWARESRHAQNKAEKDDILKERGMRYSVLNELPYWDPIKMNLLDTMHLLSGLLKYHAEKLLNLRDEAKSTKRGDGTVSSSEDEDEDQDDREIGEGADENAEIEEELRGLAEEMERARTRIFLRPTRAPPS